MTKSNIIVFPGSATAEQAAVLHEAAAPCTRRETAAKNLVTAVEAAVTAIIGLCIVTCTVAILFMV